MARVSRRARANGADSRPGRLQGGIDPAIVHSLSEKLEELNEVVAACERLASAARVSAAQARNQTAALVEMNKRGMRGSPE